MRDITKSPEGVSPTREVPTRSLAAATSVPEREGSGQTMPQVEGYQITGPLGAGGMGTVWRAWQFSTKREVALKLLSLSRLDSEAARRRFDREVELTARLQHPNVARLYDSGVYGGVYYYAMELVDGVPLDQFVARHALPRRAVLRLIRDVTAAVQYAHQLGIIHRDLKPSNILVDRESRPRVLDFGLAKNYTLPAPDSAISVPGEFLGTPAFMSPEQARGQFDALDTRTDVYSLGVILYRLVTGRPPHDLSGDQLEVFNRIANEEVRHPRRVARDLDKDLTAILLKALARDPARRYASAGQLTADLDGYLNGEPISAREPTVLYFLRKKLRKNRGYVGIAAAAVAALVGVAVQGTISVGQQRDVAVGNAVQATAQARLAEAQGRRAKLEAARARVFRGGTLIGSGQFAEAESQLRGALASLRDEGASPFAARLGLADLHAAAPAPLLVRRPSDRRALAIGFSAAGDEFSVVNMDGMSTAFGLPGGEVRAAWRPTGMTVSAAAVDGVSGRAVACMRSERSPGSIPDEAWSLYLAEPRSRTGSALRRLDGPASHLALAPGGARIACVINTGDPGPARGFRLDLLDTAAGAGGAPTSRSFPGAACAGISFSPDGRFLLLGTADGELRVFSNDQQARRLAGARAPSRPLLGFACAPGTATVTTVSGGGDLARFDLLTGRALGPLGSWPGATGCLAIDDQGRVLLGSAFGEVRVIGADGRASSTLCHGDADVSCVAVSTGGLVGCGYRGEAVAVFPATPTAGPHRSTEPHGDPLRCVSASAGELACAAGDAGGGLRVSDLATGLTVAWYPRAHGAPVCAVALSDDGTRLLSADSGGTVQIRDLPDRQPRAVQSSLVRLGGAHFSADQREVLCWGPTGWEVLPLTGGMTAAISGTDAIREGSYDRTGRVVVLIDAHGTVSCRSRADGSLLGRVTRDLPLRSAWALSEGTRVLCGDERGTLRLIDVRSGAVAWESRTRGADAVQISGTEDEGAAVVVFADGHCSIINVEDGQEVYRVPDPDVRAAYVTPHGRALLTIGTPRVSVMIRDCERGEQFRGRPDGDAPSGVGEAAALARAGEWYALRGMDDWAARTLARSASLGEPRPLAQGRSLWRLGRIAEAASAFDKGALAPSSPASAYLGLCAKVLGQLPPPPGAPLIE